MKLLILNGPPDPRPGYNPLYRGTHRAHPTHCDALPDDDELNKLFFWFLDEGGELGVVSNLDKALLFAQLWNERLKKERSFDVVEIVDSNRTSESDGAFIGFDLSCGYNASLLSTGLSQFSAATQLPQPIRELWSLVTQHYRPQLNGQGLFQSHELASLCLRSMTALQDLSPNLFEGGDLRDFQPVALYSIGIAARSLGVAD
jgi:hypothetical protein